MICAAITRGGTRCKLQATQGSYCWNHAPETAEARKRRASKAGRAGGNGRPGSGVADLDDVERLTKAVLGRLMRGEIDRRTAAVVFQGANTWARIIAEKREAVKQEEILPQLRELEEAVAARGTTGRGQAWRP